MSDRDACVLVAATHALNTIEILLTYTASEVAWTEYIVPALEVLHEVLNVQRREVGLAPLTKKAA